MRDLKFGVQLLWLVILSLLVGCEGDGETGNTRILRTTECGTWRNYKVSFVRDAESSSPGQGFYVFATADEATSKEFSTEIMVGKFEKKQVLFVTDKSGGPSRGFYAIKEGDDYYPMSGGGKSTSGSIER